MADVQISAAQSRAARAWLGISIDELAEKAGIGRRAVADFERGARMPYGRTLIAMRNALEALGAQFLFDGKRPIGILFDGQECSSTNG
jgi:transcriptional regulator with XRE-family HTH domain